MYLAVHCCVTDNVGYGNAWLTWVFAVFSLKAVNGVIKGRKAASVVARRVSVDDVEVALSIPLSLSLYIFCMLVRRATRSHALIGVGSFHTKLLKCTAALHTVNINVSPRSAINYIHSQIKYSTAQ